MPEQTVGASDVSRHKCLIYEGDPSEQLPVVVPLLKEGLHENWRCLYLGSPTMVRMVDVALAAQGIDTQLEQQRGALVLSSNRDHLVADVFDPQAMIDALCTSVDDAVRSGFEGLCATGDMKWELGPDRNFDRLLEYEARLERVFRERPLRGICQYHRDLVPAQAVRDALLAHRATYLGNDLNHDNLFYIPPELLLDPDQGTRSRQGEWMCQQILRVLKAEQVRDKAIAALERSEAQQRRLAEELARLNRDLEQRVADRTAELELANQHLESFSYSVAHDLGAPLRLIAGFSDILAQDFGERLGDEGQKHLGRVRANTHHMKELMDGMLAMGRIGNAQLNKTPVDLSLLANDVAREIRRGDPPRNAEISVQPGLCATGDPVLLRAVLANLLGNAWKFTAKRKDARIEFRCAANENGDPVFVVQDNGAGFDPRQAAKLFVPFRRLHHADEFPGNGIGLATVERIISKHGGRIWADGQPDRGAQFFFKLPRAPAPR